MPRQALSRNLSRFNFGVWRPRFVSAPSQPTVGGSFRGWCGTMFMLRSVVTPPNDGGVTRGFFNNKLEFVGEGAETLCRGEHCSPAPRTFRKIGVYCSVVDCRERPMCRSVARRFRFVCGNAPHPLVGATPCGRPWQELQRMKFTQRLEGAQILVYVDLLVNLLYNPTIAKWAG